MNNRYFLLYERIFIVVGIVFFSGSIPEEFIPRTSPIISLLRYGLWFGSTLLICILWRPTWLVAKRALLVWVVIGLSVGSFMWSVNPAHTKLVAREILQMTSFGLYFSSRFKLQEQLQLLGIGLGGIALTSALLALGMPEIGVDHTKFVGAWTGVYDHKNTLGQTMSLSVVTFAILTADRQLCTTKLYHFLSWSGLLLSLGTVILSTSQTSLLVSVVCIFLLYSYRLYQRQGNKRGLYLEIASVVIILIILWVSSSWESLITGLGRDITLTGRTEIWGVALFQLMDNRPLFGFGRGAFWAPDSPLAQIAGAAVGRLYIPPHSHNGYIDLALEIGFVGLAVFLLSYFITYRHAITRSFVSRSAKDLWPIALLSWLAFYNFTETALLTQTNLYWPLYMSAALCTKPTGQLLMYRLYRRRKPYQKQRV